MFRFCISREEHVAVWEWFGFSHEEAERAVSMIRDVKIPISEIEREVNEVLNTPD